MEINNLIKIKGYQNGLIIRYANNLNFEEIKEITSKKFSDSRKFFGNNEVCVIFEGVTLSDDEEEFLCNIIESNTDLSIVCVYHDNMNSICSNSLNYYYKENAKSNIYLSKESIINNGIIKSEKDVVIIGDVYPGGMVVSSGNIYIFGGLYGTAIAGFDQDDYDKYLILAQDMSPEKIVIGDLALETENKNNWKIKPSLEPSIAYVKKNEIFIDKYSKDLLDYLK